MKRLVAIVVVLLLGLSVVAVPGASTAQAPAGNAAVQEQCSFPFSKTDATGAEVTIENEPNRVVVLQASAAQTMWEIGAQEKVVGLPVGPYTEYLNGSQNRTNVAQEDGVTTSVETVVGTEPDLVLAPNAVSNETVQKLRDAGVTVYKFGFGHSVEDIYEKTTLTGQLVGECQGANERVAKMNETVSSITSAVEGRERPRVLYLMGGGYTPGEGTFIHAIIEAAGGDNVAANANITGYAKISNETVIAQDPQWIVVGSDVPTVPNGSVYAQTTAVQENQTVVVNSNYISQPAPRIVEPMETLAKAFHPEAFEQENETATTTTTATTTSQDDNGTAGEPTGAETTPASGPGFTVVLAALALVATALLARRQS